MRTVFKILLAPMWLLLAVLKLAFRRRLSHMCNKCVQMVAIRRNHGIIYLKRARQRPGRGEYARVAACFTLSPRVCISRDV